MIEIKDLSFSYGRNLILDGITFSAAPGECVAILGNNGAGKSTLITCINRIRTPDCGSVLIDGLDTRSMSGIELARRVSYVAQKNEMNHITVFDSVLLGRKPYIKWAVSEEDVSLCEAMIERVGLADFQLRTLDELSGGELQKVMLARALVQQPKLLLLDEPTSNLDPRNQYEMLSLVKQIAAEQSISVFIVIHDLNLAARYCDRFLFLKNHRIFSYGGAETITSETIKNVYGMDAEIIQYGNFPVVIPCPAG